MILVCCLILIFIIINIYYYEKNYDTCNDKMLWNKTAKNVISKKQFRAVILVR